MKKIGLILIVGILLCGLAIGQNLTVNNTLDYGQRSKHPFFMQNTLVNVTNTSVETTVASVVIPGNSMGSNGMLRVTFFGDADANNANAKFFIIRFGGTVFKQVSLASQKSISLQDIIWNRNDPQKQVSFAATSTTSFGTATTLASTNNINTTADQTLLITITNAVSTDSMNLQAVEVSISHKN